MTHIGQGGMVESGGGGGGGGSAAIFPVYVYNSLDILYCPMHFHCVCSNYSF